MSIKQIIKIAKKFINSKEVKQEVKQEVKKEMKQENKSSLTKETN
jgi:hypothetical protein